MATVTTSHPDPLAEPMPSRASRPGERRPSHAGRNSSAATTRCRISRRPNSSTESSTWDRRSDHVRHGKPHFHLIGWLDRIASRLPGVDGGDNSSLRLDLDNMPQPDAFLYILPDCGGQVRIAEDDYIEAAPELIAEVASSSASYDLHAKLHAYRRNGVKEYVVWRTRDRAVDWFVERGWRVRAASSRRRMGSFGASSSRASGSIPSPLIRDDRAALLRVIGRGHGQPRARRLRRAA